jgi:hypothetical protein
MEQISMNLRGKFVSGTFAALCNSASVRKNGGFVDDLVDLAVGGFVLALETPEKVRAPFARPLRRICSVKSLPDAHHNRGM